MAKTIEDARRYHALSDLNTYTAVVYLKKVTHPRGDAAATPTVPAQQPAPTPGAAR
jgi:hypothetical protein